MSEKVVLVPIVVAAVGVRKEVVAGHMQRYLKKLGLQNFRRMQVET